MPHKIRMNTILLNTSEIDRAAAIIKAGGLVGFPTETVYGLGGNALDPEASAKIYAAKGRPSDNPLIVHMSDFSELGVIAAEVPPEAKTLADAFWPGPLTMVLPKKPVVPDATTGGLKTVAVRMPMDSAALQLIKLSGVPIAAPSANISGRPSPTRWEHVYADLNGKIDAILQGEPCVGGIESTVLDLTDPKHPQVLRPGLITPEDFEAVLGIPVDYDPAILRRPDDPAKPGENLVPKAPGMKYKHYAPKAEMTLYSGSREAVAERIAADRKILESNGKKVASLIYDDARGAAASLFDDLRRADDSGVDVILAMALPEGESLNYSVMNRMLKSAGYNIIEV